MSSTTTEIEWVIKFAARFWTERRSLGPDACMARGRLAQQTMGTMSPFDAANLCLAQTDESEPASTFRVSASDSVL
jgi:hypothetical protein